MKVSNYIILNFNCAKLSLVENQDIDIDWLETHDTPTDEVHKKWENTFHSRQNLLTIKGLLVSEYTKKFLALRLNSGQNLVKLSVYKYLLSYYIYFFLTF